MNPIWILLLALSISIPASARVRKVEVTQDQIATVGTAIGIATIIQVPDRPNSIVVGDQAAFKVEYLDQAITIKPLRPAAKSNLYIYTDYRRFNVQLVTGAEAAADYVVYLDSPKPKPEKSSLRWWNLNRSLISKGMRVTLKRVAKTHDGVLLLELALSADRHETLDPKWFWLTQSGTTRPIQNLILPSLELSAGATETATIEILQSDIDENAPMQIEVRRKKAASLTIPKVTAWKQKGLP
jgi:hypothetical protein